MRVLDRVMGRVPLREVLLAQRVPAPPPGALEPGRARLFVMLRGCRHFLIGHGGVVAEAGLRRGQLLFAGADAWHRSIDRVANCFLTVIFDPQYTAITWRANRPGPSRLRANLNNWVHLPTPRRRSLEQAVLTLSELAREEGDVPSGALLLARGLLGLVRREMVSAPSVVNRARASYQAICNHLREHFHEPINRDSVARVFGLHPNHLSRLFRLQGREGFSGYLTRLRVEHGAHLLRASDLTVSEIAARCGFTNGNYFAKVFRGRYGMSPSVHRQGAC